MTGSGSIGSGGRKSVGKEVLPDRIDRYVVQRKLGSGGQGVVLLGYDPHLDLQVAIKVLHRDIDAIDFAERFQREARTMVRLTHPNVVRVYDYNPNYPYIVMEYCDGGDLNACIKRRTRLPLTRIAEILRQVLEGVGAAHESEPKILHRDLKPENVFFARGIPKVADFGLAKLLGTDATLAHSQGVLGSVRYMSPEQCKDPGGVDHRSDLWAIAVLAHELLTWERPFDQPGEDFLQIAFKIPTAPPRPPVAEVPGPLQDFIAKALEKDPDDRYGTAREMIAALDTAMAALDDRQLELFPPQEAVGSLDRLAEETARLLDEGRTQEALDRIDRMSQDASYSSVPRYWRRQLSQQRRLRGEKSGASPSQPSAPWRPSQAEPDSSRFAAVRAWLNRGVARLSGSLGLGPSTRTWAPPIAAGAVLAGLGLWLLASGVLAGSGSPAHEVLLISPEGRIEVTSALRNDQPFPELQRTLGPEPTRVGLPAGSYSLRWPDGREHRFEVPGAASVLLWRSAPDDRRMRWLDALTRGPGTHAPLQLPSPGEEPSEPGERTSR